MVGSFGVDAKPSNSSDLFVCMVASNTSVSWAKKKIEGHS